HQRDSKVRFFEVEASVDSVYQLPEPGFTANSRVINTFVSDTIVIPQVAIHDVDSMKVVYVKNHRRYEMREVALGASSMKEAIIARGLQAGEVVSLTVPPASSIKGRKLLEDPMQHEESKQQEESKQLEKPELLEEPKIPDETL
ncbi:MAG: efflux RND transporter periplasmic adaptor subunit, partial [Bacteroidales bacterium]|nr:efflux RND transporter periplasmic adaptor subunit [Bacteroidales bacterium]